MRNYQVGFWPPVGYVKAPCGPGCCPLFGGGSVVVYSLFWEWGFCVGSSFCNLPLGVLSKLVLQSSCIGCVVTVCVLSLPQGAKDWSAVCECGTICVSGHNHFFWYEHSYIFLALVCQCGVSHGHFIIHSLERVILLYVKKVQYSG